VPAHCLFALREPERCFASTQNREAGSRKFLSDGTEIIRDRLRGRGGRGSGNGSSPWRKDSENRGRPLGNSLPEEVPLWCFRGPYVGPLTNNSLLLFRPLRYAGDTQSRGRFGLPEIGRIFLYKNYRVLFKGLLFLHEVQVDRSLENYDKHVALGVHDLPH